MAGLTCLLAAIFALACGVVQGHFTLQYPQPIGELKEDAEDTAPCGGYTPDLQKVDTTDFHVGGDSIVVNTAHPQDNWLYRITTDNSASGTNWTQIYPMVLQNGLNTYCQPAVTVPEEYVGQKAVLSVVAHASDGLLYQCAAVRFVSGIGSKPESCTNSTGVLASFSDDPDLAALVEGGGSTDNTSDTGHSSSASSTPTETPGAAATTYGSIQGLGSLVTVALMVLLGAILLI